MVGEIHRAPDSRSARRATHSEMAESRRAGGWETDTRKGGDAPGRKCIAAFGKRLSALRVRPVGSSVAPQALSRSGRYRAGLQEKSEADQFRAELTELMRKFNLELHPE